MAKPSKQQQYEAKWYNEISKMQKRIETLKARGVNVHYSITKPEHITKRDIEQVQSIKRGRMLKGVSNKQISLRVEVPSTLKVNRMGKIVPKTPVKTVPRQVKETSISKAIEQDNKREVVNELKKSAERIEKRKVKSEEVKKAEQATGLIMSQWSFAPDDDEEDIPIKTPPKKSKPKSERISKLDEIISKAKAKAESKKLNEVQDTVKQEIAEQDNITVEELDREAERRAQQIELENKAAEAEIKAKSEWRTKNPTHNIWKSGQAAEKAIESIKEEYYPSEVDFEKEYSGLKSNEILYFEDKFTGTRYRYDDSRIFKRDLRGNIMHDENGKPLINERLVKVITQPLSRGELIDLKKDLLKQRYASIASERGEIMAQMLDELFEKIPANAVLEAFNLLAGTSAGDITFADMYEGNTNPLVTKLSKLAGLKGEGMKRSHRSLFPAQYKDEARQIVQKYVNQLSELDENAESWETPE